MRPKASLLACLVFVLTAIPILAQSSKPITVSVDATDAYRKMLHANLTIPVQPGDLTLLYAKWIPGEHGPTGPIVNLAGLVIKANGQTLPWVRDSVNMYAFHIHVPAGVTTLDVHDDFLATASTAGFSSGASTSDNLAMVSWNEVMLYPQGKPAADIPVTPSVTLPEGWHYGTALTPTSTDGTTTHFGTVSLEQLIDSPLLSGRYFREIPLAPEITPKHYLDMAADGPEDLNIKPELVAAFSNLVRQTGVLYASRHYNSYHFLVTLSDQVAHFGLEHHQSSDDRVPEKTFINPDLSLLAGGLLPHEFTHSWNGKYRRPAGLLSPDYQTPMKGDLLWVYEGLTEYLGDVLTVRSGIWTDQQYRDEIARTASILDNRPGRTWRDLQDTATAAQTLYGSGYGWDNWRRSVDYYNEGELIWLEVDTTIRRLSHGQKSINDFTARFHGLGGNTPPKVIPYTFNDIVSNLNAVQPYDWATFLRTRLDSKSPHAPLGGIEQGGYELVYTDKPNQMIQARESFGGVDAWYSLGLQISKSGTLNDVEINSVSYKAGLGPGMKIVAVNNRQYTGSLMHDEIRNSKDSTTPIQLIVENTGYFRVVQLDYHGGERYPTLQRVSSKPDLLDEILKPMPVPPIK
ncbi:MAG TPA: M61 family peptidase [Acidobacteriaceae bacterium]|jgi:predicted metalloprotease with PDZ domain|nr:M61 family peptidase [Acidobacteriaceae bacterium]